MSEASNMYVAKHQVKRCKGTIYQAPYFQLRSKGIGSTFFTFYPQEVEFARKNGFLYQNRISNVKVPLPRYYAEKLGVTPNYNNLIFLNEYLQRRLKNDKQTLHIINQYLNKRYHENPSLSQEQILREYFKTYVQKVTYEDTFFDKMYVKLSETSNF
jgi:hypothetical protein